MQIKHQAVTQQMQKKALPLYVLIGQDTFLLEEAFHGIKSALNKTYQCDVKALNVQTADDWQQVKDEANSFSLFAETVLLHISYDKKTLDAAGKKILTEYLKSFNTRCFIILRAPNLPAKQIQWLSNHEQVVVVVAYPLTADAIKNWIATQLKNNSIQCAQQVPSLIHQYTQGNMLACAQVIEKIVLTHGPNSQINAEQALEQLSDQCDHSLFELVEACLLGQMDKCIQILRQAAVNKSEATLVLWILTQEVRVLLQLTNLIQQGKDFRTASAQLKLWPQRVSLYQASVKRFNAGQPSNTLQQLLLYCQGIDEQIKSSRNTQVWNSFENLALSLCLGKLIGDTCTA